jgi:hypothetical protein
MLIRNCSYGMVITEKELVAVYRQGKACMKISDPIPLATSTSGSKIFSADLALMCLALWAREDLSSRDDDGYDDPDYVDPWLRSFQTNQALS